MDKNTPLTQPKNKTVITPVIFWGTIVLGSVIALLATYTVSIAFRAPRTIPNMVGLVSYFLILAGSITSIVLTSRGRQAMAAQLAIHSASMLGIVTTGLTQGRAATASFSVLLLSAFAIIGLIPQEKRRRHFVISGAAFSLMWIIEWINPPWRLVNEAAKIGPAAAIVFAIILVALVIRQAWGGNIRLKLVTAFTVISLFSVSILSVVTYISYRNQVREDVRQRLLNIASITATQLDGDLHATLQTPEDMQTEAYRQMMAQGDEIVATDPTLKYSYTMRMNEQGQIYFIIDSRQANDTERVDIGTVYEQPSETLLAYFKSPDRPIVEEEIYTDEFGSVLSAFAPFYRADGSLEGIFGIDFAADKVLEQERAVLYQILGVTLATMVIVVILGVFLGNLFTNPIIRVSQVAQKIAAGDLNARVKVETADEIGNLAIILNAMTSQLQETLQGLENRVADRTRALTTSAEVSRRLSTILDLQQLVTEVVEQVKNSFNYYHAHIYLMDEFGKELIMAGGTGDAGKIMLARGHKIPVGKGLVGLAAETKELIRVSDTTEDPDWLSNPLLPDTKSEIAVPILLGDRVLGVLDVQQNAKDGLSQEDANLLQAISYQLAVAVRNAQVFSETQQQAERETLINEIGRKIQNTASVEQALQVAARELGQALGARDSRAIIDLQSSAITKAN